MHYKKIMINKEGLMTKANTKTYKIMTLGASGAGKTVFLASMFRELSTNRKTYGFNLDIEDQKETLLNNIYTNIVDGESWPRGTTTIKEWTFTCFVKNPHLDNYQACKFTYVDYAGGLLTDIKEEDTEFKDLVKKANTLLCLLDGRKILALMNNDNKSIIKSFVKQDLPSIIYWTKKCIVPIHFVISKWDLLENRFSLKQIRDRLLRINKFQELIRIRNNAGSPVRLIPVSSVGLNFATLQADGSMKKKGVMPKPYQAEVPIACVLPDGVKAKLNEMTEERKQIENKNIDNQSVALKILKFARPVADIALEIALDKIIPLPDEYRFSKPILNKIDDVFFSRFIRHEQGKLDKLRQERDKSLQQVKDEETALNHAIDSFLYIGEKFEQDFPESNLIVS